MSRLKIYSDQRVWASNSAASGTRQVSKIYQLDEDLVREDWGIEPDPGFIYGEAHTTPNPVVNKVKVVLVRKVRQRGRALWELVSENPVNKEKAHACS